MQVGKYSSLKLVLIQVFAMYLCMCNTQGKQWSSCLTITDQYSSMKVFGPEFLIL